MQYRVFHLAPVFECINRSCVLSTNFIASTGQAKLLLCTLNVIYKEGKNVIVDVSIRMAVQCKGMQYLLKSLFKNNMHQ